MKKKGLAIAVMATSLILSSTFTSLAAWEQVNGAWKYSENNNYLSNGWFWLDGDNNGVAECYYLGIDCIMAVNTVVEGYTVDINGAWTVDGVVQTKVVGAGGQTSNTSNSGHQNQSGIPSLEDITGVTSSNMDNSDVQAGDSTGLPPLH